MLGMQLGDYVRQRLSQAETHGSILGWTEVESGGRPVHTLIPLLGLVVTQSLLCKRSVRHTI